MDSFGRRPFFLKASMTVILVLIPLGNSQRTQAPVTGNSQTIQTPATGPPSITLDPAPFLVLSEFDSVNNYVSCEAKNYAEIEWYKIELLEDSLTEFGNGKLLNFSTRFTLKDQGSYYCLAKGRSEFVTYNASSASVVVTVQGVDTYLATLFFDNEYQYDISGQYQSSINDEILEDCVNTALVRSSVSVLGFAVQHQLIEPGIDDIIGFFYLESPDSEFIEIIQSNLMVIDFLIYCGRSFSISSLHSVSFCETDVLEWFGDESLSNLTFPKTNIGMEAYSTNLCPNGSTNAGMPLANSICKGDFTGPSFWQDVIVYECNERDEQDCREEGGNNPSDVSCLEQLVGNVTVTEENVEEISERLAELTEEKTIDEDNLVRVVKILELIVQVNNSSPEVTENVLEIADNIIDVGEDVYRNVVSNDFAPSRIVRAIETQLTNLQQGDSAMNLTFIGRSVGASALRLEEAAFETSVTFGTFFSMGMEGIEKNMSEDTVRVTTGTGNVMADSQKSSITLPSDVLDGLSFGPNNTVPVTFIVYQTSVLFMNNDNYEQRQGERLESMILAATVEGQSITNLSNPVVSRFRLLPGEEATQNGSRSCVFWNFSLANGFGAWSSEGCELVNISEDSNESIAECRCYHLTNFAVLLSPQAEDSLGLRILSIIGCVVSVLALLITITIFLVIKKLRQKLPQQILVNLCFALLGLYVIFLIYITTRTLSNRGCIIVGALIHYFCLASVAWMCVEATNMYLLFVKVFDAAISGFLWKAMLAAWGIPLVVVVVSVGAKSDAYISSTNSLCFPQDRTPTFYVAVLTLVGLMLLYNLVIFILVIRSLTCGRVSKPVAKEKRKEMFQRAQSIIIITVILGMTWFIGFFGFLSKGIIQVVFDILFIIFNSLQGVFIFALFVLRPANVRNILLQRWRHQTTRKGRHTVKVTLVSGNDQKPITSETNSTNIEYRVQVTNV